MFRRNLWKFILSAALVLWSVFTLLPLNDQPLGETGGIRKFDGQGR
jgi:hypothetical protein